MKILSITIFTVFCYLFFSYLRKEDFNKPKIEIASQTITTKKTIIPRTIQKVVKEKKTILINPIKKVVKIRDARPKLKNVIIQSKNNYSLMDQNGNLYITQVKIEDSYIIAHGDIIVGHEIDIDDYTGGKKTLILKRPTLWPKGIIPYTIGQNISASLILSATKEFQDFSNIKFIKRTNEKNYIHFKEGKINCYSNIGMIGNQQTISLSSKCKKAQIMHELFHSLGFLHEQNRIDRDEFVKVLWENIKKENHLQFQIIDNKFIDLSQFSFDYDSIMLYGSNYFSKYKDDFSMVTRDGRALEERPLLPSRKDWQKLNHLYPKK